MNPFSRSGDGTVSGRGYSPLPVRRQGMGLGPGLQATGYRLQAQTRRVRALPTCRSQWKVAGSVLQPTSTSTFGFVADFNRSQRAGQVLIFVGVVASS